MTNHKLEQAANKALEQIKPICTGMSCDIFGLVLSYLTANWLLSLQTVPPDPDATQAARADALENLAQEVVRLVQQHEMLLKNPQ